MPLQAFHRRDDVKQGVLSRIRAHMAANEVVPGPGFWDGKRGSLIGVAAHGNDPQAFEDEFGIAQGLLPAAERIWRLAVLRVGLHMDPWDGFSRDDVERLRRFPQQWLATIPPGADVSDVPARVVIECLRRAVQLAQDDSNDEVKALLGKLLLMHEQSLTSPLPRQDWRAVRQQSSALAARLPRMTMDGALAGLAATAAWPATPTGALAAEVIEIFVELSQIFGRRKMDWTADEEALRVKLEKEREAHMIANMGQSIAPYDEAVAREHGPALKRIGDLRFEVARHTMARILEAEQIFLALLDGAAVSH